jgi:hypothetical protein
MMVNVWKIFTGEVTQEEIDVLWEMLKIQKRTFPTSRKEPATQDGAATSDSRLKPQYLDQETLG